MQGKLNNSIPNKFKEPQLKISFDFQKSLDEISILSKDICFHCGGSGDLFAMQNMAVIGGGVVRGPDTKVKCNHCHGTGRC